MALQQLRRKTEVEALRNNCGLSVPHGGKIAAVINITGELGACSREGVQTYLVFGSNGGGFNVLQILTDPPIALRPATTDGFISFTALLDPKSPEQEYLGLLLRRLGIKSRHLFLATIMDALASLKA